MCSDRTAPLKPKPGLNGPPASHRHSSGLDTNPRRTGLRCMYFSFSTRLVSLDTKLVLIQPTCHAERSRIVPKGNPAQSKHPYPLSKCGRVGKN